MVFSLFKDFTTLSFSTLSFKERTFKKILKKKEKGEVKRKM